ncbi:NAD(P)/FAD-dependent oxidoreductase [Alkalibacter saccharofermentans]|uniref:Aminoacetone oxidase family FAD-binding enzyme n=1 Tax=Alkalibacter saccharofermentans DSM 14828 TaxID=1120975 RepID=A0A1M4Z6F2_9FIRM|nr:hypothetical protein SAMN02746064_01963 [Alkalibacter saccharofermentans DSM 14828]
MYKVVVIGGGPAGMMAAGKAASQGNDVVLLDKNEKLGKKLFITGKGRCNFTNDCDVEELFENVITNKKFLYSAFYSFTNMDTIAFFNQMGLKEKVERGGRVFPASDKSSDVIKAMERYLAHNNVKVMLNTGVKDLLIKDGKAAGVILDNGEELLADKVILATGGVTYPQTGSTGDGLDFAKKTGHSIKKAHGALIPLVSEDPFIKELQGLSLRNIKATLFESGKKKRDLFGEMIFTHFGISGPVILSLSSYVKEGKKYFVEIDLKPALDIKTLDRRLQRDFEKYSNKQFKNSLDDLLPQRLIPVVIKMSGIDEQKRANQISKEERLELASVLKGLKITVKSKADIKLGIVTSGGIETKDIDPSTMESKKISGLYFAGEVIDVDAMTGGFNLQIAFSTGYIAGLLESREDKK